MSASYLIPIPIHTFYVVVGGDATNGYTIPLRFVGAQCDSKNKWGPRVYYKAILQKLHIVMLIPLSPTFMNGRHVVARVGWTSRKETKLTVYEIINIRADKSDVAGDYAKQHELVYLSFEEFSRRLS